MEPLWHGFKGNPAWPPPQQVTISEKSNRPDRDSPFNASEYMDIEWVLEEKMMIIAKFLKNSVFCVGYIGAGLSRASGIPDYATKAKETVVTGPKLNDNLEASPTYAHCVLTHMERAGYVKLLVQQNHDGLPQKSGFPQEKINEIHGSWYDPSNPVVKFSGSLRKDLFKWMLDLDGKVDLCLCLGTSLSGMTADIVAKFTTAKSMSVPPTALGTVIINLQKTNLDDQAVIRVWAKLDDAFRLLANNLGFLDVGPIPPKILEGDIFEVPYNEKGAKDIYSKMILDLREGASVVVVVETAINFKATGTVVAKRNGHYSVRLNEVDGIVNRLLGTWWIDAAICGTISQLPLINTEPKITTVPQTTVHTPHTPEINIMQSHHTLNESGQTKHKWTLGLGQGAELLVQEVAWKMDNSFSQPLVNSSCPPFSLKRTSVTESTVNVTIRLKPDKDGKIQILRTKHPLSFAYDGDIVKVTIVKL